MPMPCCAGLKRAFDPHNIMNPGSVFPIDDEGAAVLDDGPVP